MPRIVRPLLVLCLLLASCTSWERRQEFEGWTLYVQSGEPVEVDLYRAGVQPAFEAVEALLGPFEREVRVHALHSGVDMQSGNRGVLTGDGAAAEEIEGIGPARVPAYHLRGDGGPFSPSGVFMTTTDTGTAVHEFVHAYFAERGERLPLWFEEGFAMLLGDGALRDGRWQPDGLSAWPWRKLREEPLSDEDLARLLAVRAGDDHSARDNVLVHFLGWTVVFDLYREYGTLDWQHLLEHFRQAPDPVAEARRRMEHTLADATPLEWLARLQDPSPAVRLAAARGTWKLHSAEVHALLVQAIFTEEDPEVRASLAVNALATASQTRLRRRQEGRMWRAVLPVLRDTQLPDPDESSALRTLYRAYRSGSRNYDAQGALARLHRFWEE
ncbi:MAG: HEAT repeat domain-containing protein [Planctomycetes bacterium]|nr:HEAT repeat domain-containing protein [Planctomycetota bacterium]